MPVQHSGSRREAHKLEPKTRNAVAMVKAKEMKPIMVEARLIGASVDCEESTTPMFTTHVVATMGAAMFGHSILARRSLAADMPMTRRHEGLNALALVLSRKAL
jgi:hypothetical protein